MQMEFGRADIHMGDNPRPQTFAVHDSCTMREALDMIAPGLPNIRSGWVVRAKIGSHWADVGTCGPPGKPNATLANDVALDTLAQSGTVVMFGIPAR